METDWMTILREIRRQNQEETKNMSIDQRIRFENDFLEDFLKKNNLEDRLPSKEELVEA